MRTEETRSRLGRTIGQFATMTFLVLVSAACIQRRVTERARSAAVDESRIVHADREPGNWMTYGRTYDEQRFSPLNQINDRNVAQLGLAWYFDLDTQRGQEATPIVVDSVMYFTTAWSKVFALSAVKGELLWSFDPKVPGAWAVNACCDVVNRGVAVWNGKVFFGTLDGRLIALDAATGRQLWETLTIDRNFRYTSRALRES